MDFTPTRVTLKGGEAVIEGNFRNTGNSGGYIEKFIIRNIRTTDRNNRFVWGASNIEFDAKNLYVGSGEIVYYTFYYWDSDIPNSGVVNSIIDSRTIHTE